MNKSPSGYALASLVYPGPLLADLPTVLALGGFDQQTAPLGDERPMTGDIPAYPIRAEAFYPSGPTSKTQDVGSAAETVSTTADAADAARLLWRRDPAASVHHRFGHVHDEHPSREGSRRQSHAGRAQRRRLVRQPHPHRVHHHRHRRDERRDGVGDRRHHHLERCHLPRPAGDHRRPRHPSGTAGCDARSTCRRATARGPHRPTRSRVLAPLERPDRLDGRHGECRHQRVAQRGRHQRATHPADRGEEGCGSEQACEWCSRDHPVHGRQRASPRRDPAVDRPDSKYRRTTSTPARRSSNRRPARSRSARRKRWSSR